ncbi:MAG: BACON domain-containing protein [Tidjanibacter sp.]|nr:BACON domain-containing protein [Tidjanibacter sp.]
MNFKRMLLFLAAPLALLLNSCVTEGPEYTLPQITVTDANGTNVTAVSFTAEGGDQTFTITATRSWTINSQADWFAVTPSSYTNELMTSDAIEVTLTAAPNEGGARNETIKISMDKTELNITVSQAGQGQTALGEVLYYDNFDKGGQAQKGSSGWDTYMDGDKGRSFCNPTPENQANVSYTGTKLTVRSNSANGSAGQHSNYEGSGVNYLWFGTAPTNFTVSGISLENLEGNALTLSFGTERYEYEAPDNTFKKDEFKVYISGDGEKWTQIDYFFLDGVNINGKWNIATSQFNLKEVPATLSIYVEATVGAAYALDDLKITAGGGGAEIDLSAGSAISGGNTGGNPGGNPGGDPNAVKATVQEFLNAAEDATVYELTGEITRVVNTNYGNFDITDATGTVYVYGLLTPNGEAQKQWAAAGLKEGDTITVQGTRTSYNGTAQMKNATYISHTAGEGGGTTEPEPPVAGDGEYASDSPFVQSTDDSTNAAYTLGDSKVNGEAATGFKLGKSKQEGKFTSKAIGVSGDKYLNFYAISWGAGGDKTIYFRVNGGEAIAQPIKANDGAAGSLPYTITVSDSDHYSILLSGLKESDVIEFSTNAAFDCAAASDYATRAIFFGVKLTDEAGGNTGGGTTEPEPEEPEEPETPAGITSIADVLALGQGATISNAMIEGVVISNMDLNNLTSKKGMYVQDATGGLQFYLAENHTFAFGDKVQIDLSGAQIATYNDATQISGLALAKITKISSGNAVEAKTVSMADFLANKYESQYVALEGVQVVDADLSKTWVMGGAHTSINMEDEAGNKFVVFSSKYATYGAETVAQGSGTIKGIAGYNKGTVQIIFGQESDYAGLTNARFGQEPGGEEPGGGEEPEPEDPEDPEEPEEPAGETTAQLTISSLGFANAQSVEGQTINIDDNVTMVFRQAASANAPAYYTSGEAIRMYQNGATLEVSAGSKTITSIELTFANNHYYVGADCGELSAEASVRTWTGESSSVKFTSTGTDKNHRAYEAAIKVTYK